MFLQLHNVVYCVYCTPLFCGRHQTEYSTFRVTQVNLQFRWSLIDGLVDNVVGLELRIFGLIPCSGTAVLPPSLDSDCWCKSQMLNPDYIYWITSYLLFRLLVMTTLSFLSFSTIGTPWGSIKALVAPIRASLILLYFISLQYRKFQIWGIIVFQPPEADLYQTRGHTVKVAFG